MYTYSNHSLKVYLTEFLKTRAFQVKRFLKCPTTVVITTHAFRVAHVRHAFLPKKTELLPVCRTLTMI